MYNLTPFPGDAKLEDTFGSEVKETSVYSFDGYGSQVWDEITMKFTAASTSQRLTFQAVGVEPKAAYMGIDGVRFTTTSDTGNNGPVANDDGNIVNEGELTVGNVFDNDTDADGDLLQIISITKLPDHGSLTSNSSTGEYVYQHFGDEEFSDSFTYVVTDGTCTDTCLLYTSPSPRDRG